MVSCLDLFGESCSEVTVIGGGGGREPEVCVLRLLPGTLMPSLSQRLDHACR